MKKELFYVCALFLLMMGAAGCNKDDNDDENVVQEVVATEEVKAFFEKDSKNITEKLVGGFFTYEDYESTMGIMYEGPVTTPISPVKILAIHSQEELEEVYKGTLTLPKIDFSQHMLLVGLTYRTSGRYTFGRLKLLHNGGCFYELQVIMYNNTKQEVASNDIKPVLFWALYPKFPTSAMSVVRRVEDV